MTTPKSSAETGHGTDAAGTVAVTATGAEVGHALDSSVTGVPTPRVWLPGDDCTAETLNREWRDPIRFLLGDTRAGFSAYNSDATYKYTSLTPIPLRTEELKVGAITHATNSARVTVGEAGRYSGVVHIGTDLSDGTTLGTFLTANLLINSSVALSMENTITPRVAGWWGTGFGFTVPLIAGDYLEIALSGTWGASSLGIITASDVYPRLDLWWRC